MKIKVIGYILSLLVLMGVTALATLNTEQSSQIEATGKQCVREGEDSLRGSYYRPEQIGWSERIWVSGGKGRPYRNRLRRYRLGKKERRQIWRHLRGMAEIVDEFSGSGEKVSSASPRETVPLIGASSPSERWC